VVKGVAVDQGDQVVAVGRSVQLTATVEVSGGASSAVTWSTGDSSVAEIDATGLLTAVELGEAIITATSVADDSKEASIEVEVVEGQVVTVAAGRGSIEIGLAEAAAERYMEANPAVIVDILDTPELYGDRLAYYLSVFEAESSELDVVAFDVIWAGDLAVHLVDLYGYGATVVATEHFPAIVENNTADGRLIGIPWFTDAGLLYYRTDLLADYGYVDPPATWSELTAMAQAIQAGERAAGNPDFWGFVWQGNAYEGLTCNALEWIASNSGGQIIEPDGVITVNNPNAIEIVDLAASWVGTISPSEVTGFAEESARDLWQAGNAAFMRNWPYAYALGQGEGSAVAGLFDVSPLPAGDAAGGTPAGTLGGFQLGASRHSEDPGLAADVALFFASYEEQKTRAIEAGYAPTIMTLYEDEDVLTASPFLGDLYDVFVNAVARPSTVASPNYVLVSSLFFNAVHGVLTGAENGETAMEALESDLAALTGFPTGTP